MATAINLLVLKGDWRPLEIFTEAPIKEEHLIRSFSGRLLRIRVWRPNKSANKPRSTLLIYAPFIESSSDDPRMVNLANTFARAGFLVVAPWRDDDPFIVNLKDIDDVVSTVLFVRENIQLEGAYYGLFGISAYSGPVIAAAADSRIKEWVRFVISFAGYYHMQNVLRFVRTGQYSYKDISGTVEPDFFARTVLAKQLEYYRIDEESFLTREEFEKLRRDLSPSTFVDQLKADFFIIHSTDDAMIPHTESMRLADALKDRVAVHFALTGVFEHGSYKIIDLGNLRRYYLPAMIDIYKILYALLSKHL